jgi:hypothetical protein
MTILTAVKPADLTISKLSSSNYKVGCDTVQSSPDSRGGKPGPAGPDLKNIGTGPD